MLYNKLQYRLQKIIQTSNKLNKLQKEIVLPEM